MANIINISSFFFFLHPIFYDMIKENSGGFYMRKQEPEYDRVVDISTWVLLIIAFGAVRFIHNVFPYVGTILIFIVTLILAFGDHNYNLKNLGKAILMIQLIILLFLGIMMILSLIFHYNVLPNFHKR
jgi:hypothetical protein